MDEPLSITLRLLLVVALVLLNGMFVAAEFAIVTVRRTRVEALAERGNPLARLTLRAIGDVNNYLAATQLGITMASIGLGFVGEPVLAALLEPVFEDIFGETLAGLSAHAVAVFIAFALITGLHIVLGELTPKSLALFRPERVSLFTVPPTEAFRIIFWPVIWILNGLANAILRPFGLRAAEGGAHSVHTAEDISLLVAESAEAGALEQGEAQLLSGVFSFGDRRVNEVMVPRTEVVWLQRDATVSDFYETFSATPHSRFPVYGKNQDDVVGIVGIKDVLRGIAENQLSDDSPIAFAMRTAMFSPETKFVGPLFFEMQRAGHQMAVIVDEYGGTSGVVTLEMLLEELVGYVSDELRPHEDEFVTVDENTFQIDGGMTITDANEEMDLELPEGEYETVGGFVLAHLGYIPTEGEFFAYNGLQISITRMTGRKIEEVTVTRQ
jgi:CBS domain containing-hemolysin-like protein